MVSWLKKSVLVLIIAVLCVFVFTQLPWGQRYVKGAIEEALRSSGFDVTIQHVDVAFPFFIRLHGISASDPLANDTPLVTCQTLTCTPLLLDLPFKRLTLLRVRGEGIFVDADAIEAALSKTTSLSHGSSFPLSVALPLIQLQSLHVKSRRLPNAEKAMDCSVKGRLFFPADGSRWNGAVSITKTTPCFWPKRVDLVGAKKGKDYTLKTTVYLATDGLDHPKDWLFGADDRLDVSVNASVRENASDLSLNAFEKIAGTWSLSCPNSSTPLFGEAFAKLATAICEVPAKGRAPISTKPIVVTMGEERSELYPRRHEQSAVASFAKASVEYVLQHQVSARGRLFFVPGKSLSCMCDDFQTLMKLERISQASSDLDGAPDLHTLQCEAIRSLAVKGQGEVRIFSNGTEGFCCKVQIPKISINEESGAFEAKADFSLHKDRLLTNASASGYFTQGLNQLPFHCAGAAEIGPHTITASSDLIASCCRVSARYDSTDSEKNLWTTFRCQDLSIVQPFVSAPIGGCAELSSHLIVSPTKSVLSISGNGTDLHGFNANLKGADIRLSTTYLGLHQPLVNNLSGTGTKSPEASSCLGLQHISLSADLIGLEAGPLCLSYGHISSSFDLPTQTLRLTEAKASGHFNQLVFDLSGSGSGQTNGRNGSFSIDRVCGRVGSDTVTLERPLVLEHTGSVLSACSLDVKVGEEGRFSGQWHRSTLLQGTGDLLFERIPLEHVAAGSGLIAAYGTIDGQCHYQATKANVIATAQAQANITRIGVIGGPDGGIALAGTCSIDKNTATGELCIAGMGIKEPLMISVSTPIARLASSPWVTIPSSSPLRGTVKGDILLSQLLEGWMQQGAGFEAIIGCDFSLNGTVQEPMLRGPLRVREGRIDLLPTGEVINDICMEGSLENRRLSIDHLTATDEKTGSITGNGIVEITPDNGFRWQADVDCTGIEAVSLDYASVIADGTVKLVGDLSSITISGTAKAKRALIDLAARFPSNIPGIEVKYRDETPQAGMPYNVFFDLSIDASDNVEIKGRGLASRWDGHLHLGDEARNLNVGGSLRCLQGSFTLSTKELTINEGSVVCAGNLFKDSRLNVIAHINLPSITAQVSLKGSLEAPKIAIQSTPPKPDNEILSLILFNKEYGDISPLQSLQLANTAMTLQQSSGPFDLLDKVKDTFGIDLIDFGSATPGAPPPPSTPPNADQPDTGPPSQDVQNDVSLKVGKYISDGVAVTVSKNVSADANFLGLEAQLAPEITADAEVGDDQEGIVSLKWKKNY